MDVERAALQAAGTGQDRALFWAQAAFTGFLFFIFVGLEPFALHAELDSDLNLTGDGNATRQACYLTAFCVMAGFAYQLRGLKALQTFPVMLGVLLFWCLLSVGWAIEPEIAVRRFGLTAMLTVTVICAVDMLGVERSLRSLRLVFTVLQIVNLASVFVIPQAIHLPDELESDLAGDWRGLHSHKNIAGPVAALAGLYFFHYGLASRQWRDWILFAVSTVFLCGTQSKNALGFFAISLIISSIYRATARTYAGQAAFKIFFAAMLAEIAAFWIASYDAFDAIMSDTEAFTGRVGIWQTVFNYLQDHWLLGAGFGSFWGIGDSSPAYSLAAEDWVRIAAHSHNGYLEIFATTGIVGLCLGVAALVIAPLADIFNPAHRDVEVMSLLFSLFLFIVLANLLETIFLDRDRPEWVVYLMVLSLLHRTRKEAPSFEERSRSQSLAPLQS